jgi:hypothetical protein
MLGIETAARSLRELRAPMSTRQSRSPAALSNLASDVMAACVVNQHSEGIPNGVLIVHLINDSGSTGDRASRQISKHPNFDQLVKDLHAVGAEPGRQIMNQIALNEWFTSMIQNPGRHDEAQRSSHEQLADALNSLVDFHDLNSIKYISLTVSIRNSACAATSSVVGVRDDAHAQIPHLFPSTGWTCGPCNPHGACLTVAVCPRQYAPDMGSS